MFGLPEADCYLSHACHYSFDTWSENSIIRPITDFTEIYKENIKVWVSENSHWTYQQRPKLNCLFNIFILLQCLRSIWLWKPLARKQNFEPWAAQQNFQQNSDRHLSLIIKTSTWCSMPRVGPGQWCQRCLPSSLGVSTSYELSMQLNPNENKMGS